MSAQSTSQLIAVCNVSQIFGAPPEEFCALHDVSLTMEEGAFVCVVGPSGCGKSTLLQIMAGLMTATAGEVRIDGEKVAGPRPDKVGVVFQESLLLPWKTAVENIEFPLALCGVPASERRSRANALLELVGLLDFAHRLPDELSGGMKQRVAIARALVTHPDLVLADEPTANLDSITGGRIVDLMHAMQQRSGTAFVIATHDEMVAARAHDVHKLHDGRLED